MKALLAAVLLTAPVPPQALPPWLPSTVRLAQELVALEAYQQALMRLHPHPLQRR